MPAQKLILVEREEILGEKEKVLDETAEKLTSLIVSDCLTYITINPEEDLENCVLTRITGLHYISDIGKFLPTGHPAKVVISDLYKIAELTADKTPKFLKEARLLLEHQAKTY